MARNDTVTFSTVRPGASSSDVHSEEMPRLEGRRETEPELESVSAEARSDSILVVKKFAGQKEHKMRFASWGEAADYVAECMNDANEGPGPEELGHDDSAPAKAEAARLHGHRMPKAPKVSR